MSAMVAVTQLAGGETEKLQDAISKLILIQTVSAAGIKVINSLQAQSALMLGIRKAQEYAATTAIAIRTAAEGKSVIATKAATVAQAAFNAIAKANPYVLLATAIIGVAGALYAFTSKSDEATEAEKRRQKEMEKAADRSKSVAEKVGGSVGEVIAKYKSLQKQWAELKNEHEKANWVKDNQSAFNSLGLSVKSVTDAENVLVRMAPQVVAALKAVAEASAFESLYQDAIIKKEKEWNRRTKRHETGDTYTLYRAGDPISDEEARAAGVRTNAARTSTTSLGGYASHTSVSNLTREEVERVNKYRRDQAIKLRKQLESEYDAEIDYYSDKWDEARANAEAARNQIPSHLMGGGGNSPKPNPNPKPDKKDDAPKFAAGSLADIENQLSELQSKYKNGLITLTPEDYQKKVAQLQKAIEDKKIELGIVIPEDKVKKQLDDLSKKDANIQRTQKFSSFDIAVGNNKPSNERDLSFIQQEMNFNDSLLAQLNELKDAYLALGDAGKESFEKISQEIESVTDKQSKLSVKAKEYSEHNKTVEKNAQNWGYVADMVGNAGNAFSSLASSYNIPQLDAAAIVANAIASVIQGYATASAQVAAGAGPIAWAAFSVAGLAQIISVIAQLHSLSGFASGGIVGGGKFVGDTQTVRVNSGEMILTSEQQTRLFRVLNGSLSTPSNNNVAVSGDVKIKGSDLYLSLRNYSKIQKSSGKNISI